MTTSKIIRTSQPQGAVGIDWSNPITKKLIAVLLPGQLRGITPLTQQNLYVPSGNATKQICSSGNMLFDSGWRTYLSGVNLDYPLNSSNSVTHLNVVSGNSSLVNRISCCGINAAGMAIFSGNGSQANYPSGWVYSDGLGGIVIGGSIQVSSKLPFVGVLRFIPYVEFSLWVNGVKDANTAIPNDWYFGSNFGGTDGPSNYLIFNILWDRALSDAEIKSISANPWQIFQPIKKPIWVSAAVASVSAPVYTYPTLAVPNSDIAAGAWTPSTSTSLYSCIDETPYNDADFISVSGASTCEVALNTTAYPGGANQVISYRASSVNGSTLTVRIRQGGTTIASWTHSLTSTITLYNQTLTSGQIAALTSGDVSVQLTAS